MWYRVLFLRYPLNTPDMKVVFVKSRRRLRRVPTWTYALRKSHKTYEIVPASEFIPRLKERAKSLLRMYQSLWLSEGEFRRLIEGVLAVNYRDPERIGDALARINEWMEKPIPPVPQERVERRYPYVIRRIPKFVASRARDSERFWYDTYVYVFSETVHLCRNNRCAVFSLSGNEALHCDELANDVADVVDLIERVSSHGRLSEALLDALRILREYLVLCSLTS
jgi:hypothetical protein